MVNGQAGMRRKVRRGRLAIVHDRGSAVCGFLEEEFREIERQPWFAGQPGRLPECMAMPDQVDRCTPA
jgi:hypothetical protein